MQALVRESIPVDMEGSVEYGISVPNQYAKRAVWLLHRAARLHLIDFISVADWHRGKHL